MEPYARAFYLSAAWRSCRAAYLKKEGGLCERCLRHGLYVPADIVHHKRHITPDNITDPRVTLSFDNLEALCWSCHEKEHKGRQRRYTVDQEGHVIAQDATEGRQKARGAILRGTADNPAKTEEKGTVRR